MKKTLPILMAIFAFLATSCTKQYEQVTPNQTIITTVDSGDWKTNDGGKTYSVTLNVPEIDSYFNQHGGVLLYASFGNSVYEQVPEVYNGVAYSYSHSPGSLEVDIQASDGIAVVNPPGSVKFKIVLVDSI